MDRRERLDDPEESLRMALEDFQSQIWTALPGVVSGVDLDAQTVSVQPSIQGSVSSPDGSSQSVNLPLLVDVPICWPRAGGFAITFPVKAGDEVLVVFASRCIDSWWQSGGVGAQAEVRMHDLSDGFAILAPTSQAKKLSDVQEDGVEMRTESRSTFIRLTEGTIFIKGNVVHEGNNTQTGNLQRTGTSTTTGKITGQGGMQVSGGSGVDMSGNITHNSGTITSNSKNIGSTHTHNETGTVTQGPNP